MQKVIGKLLFIYTGLNINLTTKKQKNVVRVATSLLHIAVNELIYL